MYKAIGQQLLDLDNIHLPDAVNLVLVIHYLVLCSNIENFAVITGFVREDENGFKQFEINEFP